MASDSEMPEPSSLIERLITSRNRDLSLLLPVVLGFTSSSSASDAATADDDNNNDNESPRPMRDRIILINPLTQGMMVIEGSSASVDSLLRDLMSKGGQPPASKASIESLASVVVSESDGECAICLDEWLSDEVVKEMPCKHRFHGNCVEKWLNVHGTCPVCRFKMPVDDSDGDLRKNFGFGGGDGDEDGSGSRSGNGRREIWLSFSLNSDRRRRNSNSDSDPDSVHSTAMESDESTTSTEGSDADNQMEEQ